MQHQRISKRYNIQFGFYAFFCVLFMVLSIQFPGLNASFQAFVVEASAPFLQAVKKPSEWVDSFEESVTGHVSVYEENKILKDELSHKQRLVRDLSILENENRNLRLLLNAVKKAEGKPLTSRVISDKKSAFSHTLIAHIGDVDDVEKGQVVINEKGLIGRVLEVFDKTARILLITDFTSRIPVKILEGNVRGIVRGTNSYNLELVFTEDEDVTLKEGMLVVTTGIDGLFPQGLPVGVIQSVGKLIYIKPDVDFSDLDFVTIQRQPMEGVL